MTIVAASPPDLARSRAHRLDEQARLDGLRGHVERNRLGQFATPPDLALVVAEHALWLRAERGHRGPVRFLDPALGTGAFFEALLRVHPSVPIEDARGFEIDPAFASAASDLWAGSGLEVTLGDFTRREPPGAGHRPNLILANPPYVRHHHLGLEAKRDLSGLVDRRVGLAPGGLAGLYVYFLLLADAWLAEGGLALWLVPSEFLDVNYGAALRSYLSERVTLLQIHRFRPSDAQFGDALVTSAVVAFEKTPPLPGHQARMTLGGPPADPDQSAMVPVESLRSARKWSRFPGDEAVPTPTGFTLGDLFVIKRGLVTGANAFFIIDDETASNRGIPRSFLTPILPSPRYLTESVIEADDEGRPRLHRPLSLVDCRIPEDEVRRAAPGLADYLAEGRDRGLSSGYLASRRTPWYAQERREPAPFLCTYMARPRPASPPFRFFRNHSRAVAPNVYLMLYPKGLLKTLLGDRPELHDRIFDRLRAIPARHLIGEGRVYGGGLHKIEPRELAALPATEIIVDLVDEPRSR
ncbi:Eco57I restriction-modification methylase domain-containing protein [Tundrisphaera lichenicola]|uniref:Eco57I restriction-modification methylase domain-containing protein n=1 Tax=Tundrisphaera lichenicola TaxID=2029860 RepID=UPI003EC12B8F